MATTPGRDGQAHPLKPPTTGHRRIGHKKSRNGCARCKARHVKCDEQVPCRNCVRHDLECSLVALASASAGAVASSTPGSADNHHSPRVPSPAARGPGYGPSPSAAHHASPGGHGQQSRDQSHYPQKHASTALRLSTLAGGNGYPDVLCNDDDEPEGIYTPHWMQSVRLFHHFCQHTAYHMSSFNATTELWRQRVPDVACSHEFLMHGLLACSAQHYARTHPAQRHEYILISTHYQTLALQFFTNRLSDIHEDNVEAYFLLATFIFMLAIASISDPFARQNGSAGPKDLAQSFILLHGIKGILDVKAAEKLGQHDGPLAAMLHGREYLSRPLSTRTSTFIRRLDRLIGLARELDSSIFLDVANNPQTACILALESLRHAYYGCVDSIGDPAPVSPSRVAASAAQAGLYGPRLVPVVGRPPQSGSSSSHHPSPAAAGAEAGVGADTPGGCSSSSGFQPGADHMHAAAAEAGQRYTWLWPLTLTPVFMQLVASGNHMALIIAAHYAALAKPYEGPFWVTQGWSESVLAIVENNLHPDRHCWIAWPKRCILEDINVDDMPDDE